MTDRPYNELCQYFQTSPDPMYAGCQNTGEPTDGVVFPGIEPLNATHCFVGRPSIIAAVAELFQTTVKDISDRLADDKKVVKSEITRLEKENRELRLKLDLIRKNLSDLLDA